MHTCGRAASTVKSLTDAGVSVGKGPARNALAAVVHETASAAPAAPKAPKQSQLMLVLMLAG